MLTTRPLAPLWQGMYEKALEDSEKALSLDGENIRALFRKARALNELGHHKEAYECSSRCSLALPHVSAALRPRGGGVRLPPRCRCRPTLGPSYRIFLNLSFLLCDVQLQILT